MTRFKGTAGDDTLNGTSGNDKFDLTQGGNDTASGGGGNDVFNMGATLNAGDRLDGGDGTDVVRLKGDYSAPLVFAPTTIVNIEKLLLYAGFNYDLVTNDANVAAGTKLTVDAGALGAANHLTFDGSAESDGGFAVTGGAGDDVLTGGALRDVFSLAKGGNDVVHGGAGNDTFTFGGALTAADSVDGGAGNDVLGLSGDYSAGLVLAATTMTGVETILLSTAHNYNLTTADGNVAAGATLTVDGSALGPASHLTFNGAAETDGSFSLTGGAANDVLTGGVQADAFDLSHGGNDTAHGGGGNDTFALGAALTSADQIDGGAGSDTLTLNGDYSSGIAFGAATMTNVETLRFTAGHSYALTINNANVAAGATLAVDGSALGAGDNLTFSGASETDGNFVITGGAGNDTLTGGAQADSVNLSHGGNDTAHGGAGNDTFTLGATLTAADSIDGGTGSDTLSLNGDYSAGLTFGAATMTNVEMLQLGAGHTYSLTTADANVAAGAALTVDASALTGFAHLIFNGAAESDGSFAFVGGAGNDTLTGGAQADSFDLSLGGNDAAHGGGGNDTFTLGAALTAADGIDGGAGSDTLSLNGDYSAGLIFGAATVTNVETLLLAAGHGYSLTTNDASVAAGAALTADASALGVGDSLVFNGAAETNGSFGLIGGAGNDTLTGGAQTDTFDLSHGGNDAAHGGAGNDAFLMGAALTAADTIDGGTGNDTLSLSGDYSAGLTFGAATMVNVETLQLAAGHGYSLATDDANIASGTALNVDGSALGASDTLAFNGGAETDGSFAFVGGAGNDTLAGGAQADTFDLTHGGNDTAHGGGGSDTFALGAVLTAADSIDGGAGSDTLALNGDYSAGLTFGATTMTNIETLQLSAGHSYNLATADANVSAGQSVLVDASALSAGDTLVFSGAAETDGSFAFVGGAGSDTLTGGAQADSFDLTRGGLDTVHGGGGNDTFTLGAALTDADSIDGGAGSDTLVLNGDYSAGLTFGATTMTGVETIQLAGGHSYALATADANVASGATLAVDASALGTGDTLTFDGSAESDGAFVLTGGAGNDALTGGTQSDGFDLSHGGNDTAHGGGGDDTFTMGAALTAGDQIDGGTGSDTLALNGDYSGGLTLGANTLTSIETMLVSAGHSYNLAANDANVASGATFTVDASALGTGDSITFNGAAETNGQFVFIGGAGNDMFTGGNAGNIFDLSHGGSDTANGGQGVNVFEMGAAFDSNDRINGALGATNTLVLDGAYFNLAVTNAMVANVQTVDIQGSNTASIVWQQAAFQPLTLDASAAGGSLSFDFSAVGTNLHFIGGALNTHIVGGTVADTFDAGTAVDIFSGGGGNDVFNFAANLTAADQVDGGTGSDTLTLNGDYSGGFTFAATTMINVETLQLAAGHDYSLATNDANVAAGATLTIDASALGSGNHLTFNGAAESDGFLSVQGGAGGDMVDFASNFAASDHVDGGAGSDTLVLDGDYAGLTFAAATIANVETLLLLGGHSYNLATNDGNVASGAVLTIDASALGAGNALTFGGAAETDGFLSFIAGAGNDVLTGGGQGDTFDLSHGGNDTAHGGGGNDIFAMGVAFTAADAIDGGTGSDTVVLDGDYSAGLTFGAATIASVEALQFAAGHNYTVTTVDANVASNGTLTLDASALGAGDVLTFNGAAETDGSFAIIGGAGNDALTGGAHADTFDLSHGGTDAVQGGAGNDTFNVGAALTAADAIDGGADSDTLVLNGDYTGGLVLGATTVLHVETMQFTAGNSYSIATNDATVGGGASLTVNAGGLGAGDALVFNGAAETDGTFSFIGGAGADTLTGGALADSFDLSHGGGDTVHGGGGTDTFTLGAALTASDSIDGGAGSDTVVLNGDYSAGLTLGAATFANIETLQFTAGHSYNITMNDGDVAAGQTLTVNGSAIGSASQLIFDGAAETDGAFAITDGGGNDILTGGSGNDTFSIAGTGNDTVEGGAGNDTITTGSALASQDTIDGGAGNDTLVIGFAYSAPFLATTITGIETIQLASFSYSLTMNDANVAAGQTLTIAGGSMINGATLTFDGSAETDGYFAITSGTANDSFTFGAQFRIGDTIDGGAGNDTLFLNGDYSAGLVFTATTLVNVETIMLAAGHSYNLTTADATVASGQTLTLNASALGAGDSLTFNGSAETDGILHITGGAGSDTFNMGAALTSNVQIAGGAGSDTLNLNGTYTSLFLGASTVTGIETLALANGHNYSITTADGTVAAGATLTVDATALATGSALTFNGSAELDGTFSFLGGAGNDALTGGALADTFDLTHGGNDTAHGGAGNDTINLGATFTAADFIDGGTGSDTVNLSGDYSAGVTFGNAMINVETLVLAAGHSYTLTTSDATVADGAVLTIDGSALGAGDVLIFNGSAEAQGNLNIIGGAGNDVITGGGTNSSTPDTFDLTHGGNDTVTGSSNAFNTFNFGATLTTADVVHGGGIVDIVSLNGNYSSGITIVAGEFTNVETLTLGSGVIPTLTLAAGSVAAGKTLTITGAVSGGFTFDGSAITNATLHVGGSGSTELFIMGAAMTANDQFSGGSSSDTLSLNGDYSAGLVFAAATVTSIETLLLAGGHSYNFTTNDGNVASGKTMTIDASGLGTGDVLTFNGSAETNGIFSFIGGAGNDVLTGGAGNDTFDLTHGGNDTVHGGSGNNVFNLGAAFNAADQIDGGGSGTLNLNGDYSAGVVFTGSTVTNMSRIVLAAGHDYNFSVNSVTASGTGETVFDASALGAANHLTFNASGGPGFFEVIGGAGDDIITGSSKGDDIRLQQGGNDTVSGGAGDDTIMFAATLNALDHVDGGSGFNAVTIAGDYTGANALSLGGGNFVNVQYVTLGFTNTYDITVDDSVVAAGQTLTIDGSTNINPVLDFNGAAETDGSYVLMGGSGVDVLIGGQHSDTFTGNGGADIITSSAGAHDTYVYKKALDSTSTGYDTINDVNFSTDMFKTSSIHFFNAVDSAVSASISTATFDSDLTSDLNGHLGAYDALLITANAGTLSGHTFLIVDENGVAGYQTGFDLVIDVTGATGILTGSDFI